MSNMGGREAIGLSAWDPYRSEVTYEGGSIFTEDGITNRAARFAMQERGSLNQ